MALARAFLEVVFGDDVGAAHPVVEPVTVVGRDGSATIRLRQDSVSRRHAEIQRAGPGFVVRDLGSLNGTFVNDIQVQEHDLEVGDYLKVGRTIFRFGVSLTGTVWS